MARNAAANQPLAHVSNSGTPTPDLIAADFDVAPGEQETLLLNPQANGQIQPNGRETRSASRTPTGDAWARKFLLAFDGGGVRGYSSLLILKELMHVIGERERAANALVDSSHHPRPYSLPTGSHGPSNDPHDTRPLSFRYLPCHYFDYCAGTSTGGLIAIMLGRLRMTVDDCIKEYETLGDKIFGESRWFSIRGPLPALREKYNGDKFAEVVRSVVKRRLPGSKDLQEAFASDPMMCRTICLAFRKNPGEEKSPYAFRTYDHHPLKKFNPFELNPGKADTVPIWQVARATAAAPSYFDPVRINEDLFVDGGFGAHNPAHHAFFEIVHCHNDYNAVALTVSIGTGESGEMSRFGSGLFGRWWAFVNFAKKWASDSYLVHRNMELLTDMGEKYAYKRFNVEEGLGEMKLDEWKNKTWTRKPRLTNKTLAHISNVTRKYLDQPDTQTRLRETADLLIANRQVRSNDDLWNHVSSGDRWRCQCNGCRFYDSPFDSDVGLKQHLAERHAEEGYVFCDSMTTEQNQKLDTMVEQGYLPFDPKT